MVQEHTLYNARLTQSSSQHILIEEGIMDDKDRKVGISEESTVSTRKQEPPLTVDQIVSALAKQLQEKPVAEWSDRQVQRALKQIQQVSGTLSSEQKDMQEELLRHQQELSLVLEARGIALETTNESQSDPLDTTLAEEWAQAVGEDIAIQRDKNATSVKVVVGKNGKEALILPEKLTLSDVIAAAHALGRVEEIDVREATTKKLISFVRQLKDATYFLARQTNETTHEPIFDNGVLTYVYEYAEQLDALANGRDVQKKTAQEIRSEATKAELLPSFYDDPDAKRSLQQSGKKKEVESAYENRLFLFLLGKFQKNINVDSQGNIGDSFYKRFFQREQRRGKTTSEQDFDAWLITEKAHILSRIARFVNNGKIATNEQTQHGLTKESQQRAEQDVLEAISQRGKQKQKEIKLPSFAQKPEVAEQIQEVLRLQPDESLVSDLFARAQTIKEKGEKQHLPLSAQLSEINQLVFDAYGLKNVNKDGSYFPAEALHEGEFGCSIQTMLVADLLKDVYGDELVLLADTTVSGNREDEISGHIRLIALTKSGLLSASPEGYFIDTHTTITNEETVRETVVDAITDEQFLKMTAAAYVSSPDDFHLALSLENTGEDDRMAVYERNHTLTMADIGIESAMWNNMAATLAPKKGQGQREYREERIRMVERSLALNPSNAIAWLQLSALNTGDQTRHNAFLQKAQALNAEVLDTVEDTAYTVDVYSPGVTTTNPDVQRLIQRISRATDVNPLPGQPPLGNLEIGALNSFIEQAQRLQERLTDEQSKEDLETIITELGGAFDTAKSALQAESELKPPYSTLNDRDFAMLSENPEQWLDLKFDALYNSLVPGQELSSPQISTFQSNFGTASGFVAEKFALDRDLVERFTKSFAHRLNAMVMRTQINMRDFDNIKRTAQTFGIDGLLESMSMDDHRVEKMFNRLTDRLDAERLLTGGRERHLKPEVVNKVQEKVIQEELTMAKKGIGTYGEIYSQTKASVENIATTGNVNERDLFEVRIRRLLDQERQRLLNESPNKDHQELLKKAVENVTDATVRQTIVRSVRFAYDLVVCSQRDAVIASRGEALKDGFEKYRADVTGINAYNLEAFVLEKWGLLNYEDQEFFDYMKRELAYIKLRYGDKLSEEKIKKMSPKELEEIGAQQFRDLFAVPDLYSSGWRIDIFFDVLKDKVKRCQEGEKFIINKGTSREKEVTLTAEKAKNLGLFLQLKWGEDLSHRWDPTVEAESKDAVRERLWREVSTYYPEEIAKLYREKKPNERAFMDCMSDPVFIADNEPADGIARLQYRLDKFLVKYEPAVRYLRGQAMDNFDQLDLTTLTTEQKDIVDKILGAGEGEKLVQMYQRLQQFTRDTTTVIENGKEVEKSILYPLIHATVPEFGDIYTRVLRVDDFPQFITGIGEITYGTLAQSQAGHDALYRAWNDNNTAIQAGGELINFLRGGPIGHQALEKKIEVGEKFAGLVAQYNGGDAGAEMVRATVGTLLLSVEDNKFLDYLGLNHLPFNMPTSKSQEIFGPGAVSMTRGDIRLLMHHLREKLVKGGHSKEAADVIVNQLEERLGITNGDMIKLQVASLVLILLMASIALAMEVVDVKGMTSGK